MRETETARRSARMALAPRSASRRVRSASTTSRKLTRPDLNRFTERSKVLAGGVERLVLRDLAAFEDDRALQGVFHLADGFENRLAVFRAGGFVRGDGGVALGLQVFLAGERHDRAGTERPDQRRGVEEIAHAWWYRIRSEALIENDG